MKSLIDWNELVPRLPKKARDDLYLEAVAILSEQDDEGDKGRKKHRRKKVTPLPADYKRKWSDAGIPGPLVAAGRKFRVVRDSKVKTLPESSMGRVWASLKKLPNDTVAIEGINLIAKSVGFERPQEAAEYLWARRLLEVVE